ncbi:MAG: hypothetical protein V3T64_01110, partial [Myxococcota bacterium]
QNAQFGTAVRTGRLARASSLLAADPYVLAPILLMAIARLERDEWKEAEWNLRILRHYQPRDPTILALSSLAALGPVVTAELSDLDRDIDAARKLFSEAESLDADHQLTLAAKAKLLELDGDERAVAAYGLAVDAPVRHSPELNRLVYSSELSVEIDEALDRLASKTSRSSAMAKRRLEERSRQVMDETAPIVELDAPQTAFVRGERVLVISGTARDDDAVEFVNVNSLRARLFRTANADGGSVEFVYLLRISAAETRVRVETVDPSGNIGLAHAAFTPLDRFARRSFPTRWGLLAAVFRTADDRFPSRTGGEADSRALMAKLARGIPAGQLAVLIDGDATRTVFEGTLDALIEESNANRAEELLVYLDFSLGDVPVRGALAKVIVPFDARYDRLEQTSIVLQEVLKRLAASRAERIVVFANMSDAVDIFGMKQSPARDLLGETPIAIIWGADRPQWALANKRHAWALAAAASAVYDGLFFDPQTRKFFWKADPSVWQLYESAQSWWFRRVGEKLPAGFYGKGGVARSFPLSGTGREDQLREMLASDFAAGRLTREDYLQAIRAVERELAGEANGRQKQTLTGYLRLEIPPEKLGNSLEAGS